MTAENRPRLAHVIPRLELRGGEVTAQHLAAALEDRFESRLYLLYGSEGPRPEGVPPIPTDPGIRRGRLLAAGRSLGRRLRRSAPDLVIAHGGDPLRAAVSGGAHRRAPLVARRISSVPPGLRTTLRMRSLQRAYDRVSVFVAVSESLRAELVEVFGVPEHRVTVIPPGRPDPARITGEERAHLREELGAAEGSLLVLWVGGLVSEKDPAAAVAVAERLRGSKPPVVLALAGDGPLAGPLGRLVAGTPNVRLLGPRRDATRLMQAADVLLSTSRTEGAPSTFVEALFAGLPIVTPDVGGVREIVEHGYNGLIASPGDAGALADAVGSIAIAEGPRAQMATAARASAAPFEIGSVAKRYAEVLDRVLSEARTAD
ncbi:MAG: glycosyltransferase family 4 protein [Actinomycetota bacterium]